MFINFNQMEEKALTNFNGGEKEFNAKMFIPDENRIVRGRLVKGASIGYHKHETNCEMIFVVSGVGTVCYEGETFEVEAGNCHYCPKGNSHSLTNNQDEDLICFAVVPTQP